MNRTFPDILVVVFLLGAVLLLSGCNTIKHYNLLTQPTGRDLETSVGGTIFKVNRSSDLPNTSGGADVSGDKVSGRRTELRFEGMTPNGQIVLQVTEIGTHSTGISNTRYGGTDILSPHITQFAFDVTKERELVIAGVRVSFVEFTPTKLRYRLEKQSAQSMDQRQEQIRQFTTNQNVSSNADTNAASDLIGHWESIAFKAKVFGEGLEKLELDFLPENVLLATTIEKRHPPALTKGKYVARGGSLLILFPDTAPDLATYSLVGDDLVIAADDGQVILQRIQKQSR